jgi:hypothetical protein
MWAQSRNYVLRRQRGNKLLVIINTRNLGRIIRDDTANSSKGSLFYLKLMHLHSRLRNEIVGMKRFERPVQFLISVAWLQKCNASNLAVLKMCLAGQQCYVMILVSQCTEYVFSCTDYVAINVKVTVNDEL